MLSDWYEMNTFHYVVIQQHTQTILINTSGYLTLLRSAYEARLIDVLNGRKKGDTGENTGMFRNILWRPGFTLPASVDITPNRIDKSIK